MWKSNHHKSQTAGGSLVAPAGWRDTFIFVKRENANDPPTSAFVTDKSLGISTSRFTLP